jgi:3-dehydro-L-gulonate 2-dehydrogenase
MPRIPYQEVEDVLTGVLAGLGFDPPRARLCARLFAETHRDGVYSHGLNRFPRFVEQIRKGIVDPRAAPVPAGAFGAVERWDGRGGPGNLNARLCMDRALALSRQHGIGCVALANTNHWMRGGSYGWQAVEAGAIGMCWTNTMANLPAWGAAEPRVGNNPLVIAVPHAEGPVVLDMAMSQFSFGALEGYRLRGEQLPVDGGFDGAGNLTRDPAAIEASQRALPIGYWKGSGLAMMLDLLGALLSGGLATHQIPVDVIRETRLTQVFLAFDLPAIDAAGAREQVVRGILESVRGPVDGPRLRTPGERILRTRRENLAQGIPVDDRVWQAIGQM